MVERLTLHRSPCVERGKRQPTGTTVQALLNEAVTVIHARIVHVAGDNDAGISRCVALCSDTQRGEARRGVGRDGQGGQAGSGTARNGDRRGRLRGHRAKPQVRPRGRCRSEVGEIVRLQRGPGKGLGGSSSRRGGSGDSLLRPRVARRLDLHRDVVSANRDLDIAHRTTPFSAIRVPAISSEVRLSVSVVTN